jgi:hypothetical protein
MAEQKTSGFVVKKTDEISSPGYYHQENTLTNGDDKITFRTRCTRQFWGLCGSMTVNFESKTESIRLYTGNLAKSLTHNVVVYFQQFDMVKSCHNHFLNQLMSHGFNWKTPPRKDLEKFEAGGLAKDRYEDEDMDSESESDD